MGHVVHGSLSCLKKNTSYPKTQHYDVTARKRYTILRPRKNVTHWRIKISDILILSGHNRKTVCLRSQRQTHAFTTEKITFSTHRKCQYNLYPETISSNFLGVVSGFSLSFSQPDTAQKGNKKTFHSDSKTKTKKRFMIHFNQYSHKKRYIHLQILTLRQNLSLLFCVFFKPTDLKW